MQGNKKYKLNKFKVTTLLLVLLCICLISIIAVEYQSNTKSITNATSAQSNKIDNDKEQLIITSKKVEVKSMASSTSDTVGYVYQNEIYNILEKSEDEKWIHIKTENNINGYIYVGDNHENVSLITKNSNEIEITEEVEDEKETTTTAITNDTKVTTTTSKTTNKSNTTTTKKNGTTKTETTTTTTTTTKTATVTKTYTIVATSPDSQSPARVLTVYENGTKISYKQINYSDGTTLCTSTCNVNKSELDDSTYQVILTDGTKVVARLS